MAEKKERGRFTIKLNENDPAQEAAIRLLERQPPRTKAQLIANALLHYGNCPAAATIAPQDVSRETIQEIVREVLSQLPITSPGAGQTPSPSPVQELPQGQDGAVRASTAADSEAFSMIADTLAAFRGS